MIFSFQNYKLWNAVPLFKCYDEVFSFLSSDKQKNELIKYVPKILFKRMFEEPKQQFKILGKIVKKKIITINL